MRKKRGSSAELLWLVVIALSYAIGQGQEFTTLAESARATAEAEPARAAEAGDAPAPAAAPTAARGFAAGTGGGLSTAQQQSRNHGNRRVSGSRVTSGRVFQRTGRAFGALSALSSDQVRATPAAARALQTVLSDVCPTIPICNPLDRFRTADGSCNNLLRPLQGAFDTPQGRFLRPAYQDGEDSPRVLASDGSMLPSARLISITVHRASSPTRIERGLTMMVFQWGQFKDHDIVLTPTIADVPCCTGGIDPPECFHITIPAGDPRFPGNCMPLIRSLEAIALDCVPGKREQTNLLTSYVDASNVYGSTKEDQDLLRTGSQGLLRTSAGNLLPEDPDPLACTKEAPGDFCLKAGDERVSEHPVLTTMHTVFVREHNYLATRLRQINPGWDDERLFQEARKIVAAELQHITYNEYLPIILGPFHMNFFGLWSRRVGHARVYDQNIDASIVNVFAAASFRFGHSQIPDIIAKATQNFVPYGARNLENTFFKPNIYHSETGGVAANALSRWSISANGLRVDSQMQRSVVDFLFLDGNNNSLDLSALNIQRGRDHGLPPYNEFRALCGLPRVRHWGPGPGGMVDHTPEDAMNMRRVYRSPDDIDMFTGGLSERRVYRGLVGPTNACIIGNQFRRLKLGDRFFYENPFPYTGFTQGQLREIKKIRLSKILCRNMNTFIVQPNVFFTPNFINRYRACQTLPDINLEYWRETNQQRSPGPIRQLQPPSTALSGAARLQTMPSFVQLNAAVRTK